MHSLSGIVYLEMPLENGFTGIFFSVLGKRLIWCSTHRGVKLDFQGMGRGDASSLGELSKAVGGCLFPLRRDVFVD